jgi:hypothetical protein
VTGRVTFDGQFVEDGVITLNSLDPAVGSDAGRFDITAKQGPKKVEIRASRVVGQSAMGPVKKKYIPAATTPKRLWAKRSNRIAPTNSTLTLSAGSRNNFKRSSLPLGRAYKPLPDFVAENSLTRFLKMVKFL